MLHNEFQWGYSYITNKFENSNNWLQEKEVWREIKKYHGVLRGISRIQTIKCIKAINWSIVSPELKV